MQESFPKCNLTWEESFPTWKSRWNTFQTSFRAHWKQNVRNILYPTKCWWPQEFLFIPLWSIMVFCSLISKETFLWKFNYYNQKAFEKISILYSTKCFFEINCSRFQRYLSALSMSKSSLKAISFLWFFHLVQISSLITCFGNFWGFKMWSWKDF